MKKVYGVGINDAPFMVTRIINGKKKLHPAYNAWTNMLARCYLMSFKVNNPAYDGCFVCEEWLSFINFHSWWSINYVEGWHLDKDLLVTGNKEYGPNTCIYIPRYINAIHLSRDSVRGDYPVGVTFHQETGKFRAKISKSSGCSGHLGLYMNPIDAHKAWYEKKMSQVMDLKDVCDSINPHLHDGLISKINSMREF